MCLESKKAVFNQVATFLLVASRQFHCGYKLGGSFCIFDAKPVGHLTATAFAAIHAFPITGKLPTPALQPCSAHAHELGHFFGAGISSNPFFKDMHGLLGIVWDVCPPHPLHSRSGFFLIINNSVVFVMAFYFLCRSRDICLIPL